MALISTFVPSVTGTAPTYGAAAASDTAECGSGYWLIVKNGAGSSITVTITVPGNLVTGDAYPDKAYTVTAGAEAWIPLLDVYRDPTAGTAAIAWSSTTTVTRAVVKV